MLARARRWRPSLDLNQDVKRLRRPRLDVPPPGRRHIQKYFGLVERMLNIRLIASGPLQVARIRLQLK